MAPRTPRLTRRQWLLGLGGAAAAGASYARFGEAYWLELSRVDVPALRPGAADTPVRIVHLSDFHASSVVSLEFIAEAVDRAMAQKPDVVALTGDFITNHLHEPARYAEILGRLSRAAPTFACLGNHDGGPWTRRAGGLPTTNDTLAVLQAAGVTCLPNQAREISVRGRLLQFVGVGDYWSGMCEPVDAFQHTTPRGAATRILLNHNPDAKDLLRPFDWDLMLCGHTHGGQFRLPWIGTPFAPVIDKRYVSGLHRWRDRWLYITRGVGNLHGVRFNCRPEISVLDVA